MPEVALQSRGMTCACAVVYVHARQSMNMVGADAGSLKSLLPGMTAPLQQVEQSGCSLSPLQALLK